MRSTEDLIRTWLALHRFLKLEVDSNESPKNWEPDLAKRHGYKVDPYCPDPQSCCFDHDEIQELFDELKRHREKEPNPGGGVSD